jgi:hypothetical protein
MNRCTMVEGRERTDVFSYGPGLPGPAGRRPAMLRRERASPAGAGQARPVRMLTDRTQMAGPFVGLAERITP